MGRVESIFFTMTNAAIWMNWMQTCILVFDDFLLPFKLSCESLEDLIPQYCNEWRLPSLCTFQWQVSRLTRDPSFASSSLSFSLVKQARKKYDCMAVCINSVVGAGESSVKKTRCGTLSAAVFIQFIKANLSKFTICQNSKFVIEPVWVQTPDSHPTEVWKLFSPHLMQCFPALVFR
jgi:hypothetical protein